MIQSRSPLFALLPLVALTTTVLQAQNWPSFRGPALDGKAPPDARPPTSWSDEKNIAWRVELPGPGASSPLVVGDRVFVTSYSGYAVDMDDQGEFTDLRHHVSAFSRATGELLWQTDVDGNLPAEPRQVQIREHGFASPTPAVSPDGKTLYVYFGKVGALAVDAASGEVQWKTDLGTFEGKTDQRPRPADRDGLPTLYWGAAASPVVWQNLVLFNASEESDSVRALDRETGKLVWMIEDPALEGSSVTPAVFEGMAPKAEDASNDDLLVVVPGGELWGIDPATGKKHWTVPTGTKGGMSPMPLTDGERIYAFGGGPECFALDLDDEGQPTVAWKSLNTDIPSAVLHDGKIFMVQTQGQGAVVETAKGDAVFRGRWARTGGIYASPTLIGDHLYVVSREKGTFVFDLGGKSGGAEADGEEATWEPALVDTNVIESDESRFHGSPAVSGDRLYLRSERFLYCIAPQGDE